MGTFEDEIAGGAIRMGWNAEGGLEMVMFGSRAVPQPARGGYLLNGRSALSASGDTQQATVSHRRRFSDGALTASWTGGEQLSVVLEADTGETEVREVGFVMDLPRGDLLSLVAEPCRWEAYSKGQRICFSDFPFGVGQVYLLDLGDACLRFGRQVRAKRDYPTGALERTAEGWRLTWLWEPQLPYPKQFESQELHFRLFDSVGEALEEHRTWCAATFGWQAKETSRKVPAWFKDCRLLLQLNLGETNGAVLHDFRDVTLLAEDMHALGIPAGALIYIPDYNPNSQILRGFSGPLCACWPENPLLGGKTEFKRMVETARKYGYHILPHGNLVFLLEWSSRNFGDGEGDRAIWRNPAWDRAAAHAIMNASGRPIGWPPDEVAERYPYMCRYVNLGHEDMRAWFLELTSAMIREYELDAFYFDSVSVRPAISYQGNIPHMAEIVAGERLLLEELYRRHPDVLFAGELCDEENVDLLPLWQERSAISHALFAPYIYTFAHTVVSGPLPQRYVKNGGISMVSAAAQHDEVALSRRQPNNIPRLLLNYRDYRLNGLTQGYIAELLATRGEA